MSTDCMICFGPIRLTRRHPNPWYPDLPCTCRPPLHRACWETWSRHVGYPSCVICRDRPAERAPLPPPFPPDPVAAAEPPAARLAHFLHDDVAPFIGIFFLVWMIIMMTYPRQVVYVTTPPPPYLPPYPYRDEL
jgi:hypothetical protein